MSIDERTPVDVFLAAQANLTAVERFARKHEADLIPHQEAYYRDLIPLAAPGPGEQYGFEVDLDSCTGCKSCVTACHNLNGLDETESWRRVAVLHGGTPMAPYQQTVTAACHHCVDPACQTACPVDAYEKDPTTGIVIHLDDQCIGCSYCTLACPYEVPEYSHERGIVRKCDMCRGRLEAGEAPACVQACPNLAIRISVIDLASLAEEVAQGAHVPGSPPSTITMPSTRYLTTRDVPPTMDVVEVRGVEPALAHTPLAVMLVLTQMSVGAFVIDLAIRLLGSPTTASALRPYDAVVALATGLLALGASVLHLGRPRLAYRAVIGLRHSWLSREVVAFGAFAGLATVDAVHLLAAEPAGAAVSLALAVAVAAAGVVGVGCSVMIYGTTHRWHWRPAVLAPSFFASGGITGAATVLWVALLAGSLRSDAAARSALLAVTAPLALTVAGLVALKLAASIVTSSRTALSDGPDVRRRRILLEGALRTMVIQRLAVAVAGGLVVPLAIAAMDISTRPAAVLAWVLATLSLGALVVGELLERSLFFRTASPPRMAGRHVRP